MKSKIVADSCCDLNVDLKQRLKVDLVPLTIEIDGHRILDDESMDTGLLLQQMKDSTNAPKTSCPSPGDYMERFKTGDNIFVVTLSSALSGSYSSALLAKNMYQEQDKEKFIHVFDSLSASIGETLISMKIHELIEEKLENHTIVDKVNRYIKEMKTFFVLESLDNLIKSGRLSKVKGKLASVLNIKPIMGEDGTGNIREVEKVRGSNKAIRRLIEIIGEQGERLEEKVIGIAHCNALEKARHMKEEILRRYRFKDIIIVNTAGISTVYANEGGIIIAF